MYKEILITDVNFLAVCQANLYFELVSENVITDSNLYLNDMFLKPLTCGVM